MAVVERARRIVVFGWDRFASDLATGAGRSAAGDRSTSAAGGCSTSAACGL
jgi:hypothetical protein